LYDSSETDLFKPIRWISNKKKNDKIVGICLV
jgi:hypothetical protein